MSGLLGPLLGPHALGGRCRMILGAQRRLCSTFTSLGLGPRALQSLDYAGFNSPTTIQARGIPAVLRGGDVLLAGATGSGKTIAYIAPVLDILARPDPEETRASLDSHPPSPSGGDGSVSSSSSSSSRVSGPRAVLLVPNRELVNQVSAALASLCGDPANPSFAAGPGSSLSFAALFSVDGQLSERDAGCDVWVCTPTVLVRVMKRIKKEEKEHAEQARAQAETVDLSVEDGGGLKVRAAASEGEAATSLSAVRVVVLDEVDMLLDGSFEGTTKEAIKGLRKAQLTGSGGGAGGGGGKNRPHRQRHGTGGSAAPPESRLPQFVLAGATIPDRGKRSVRVWIERIFRGLTEVADDALHTATHNVTHRFVPLYPNEVESRPPAVGRLKALHRVLEEVLSDEYYIPLRGEEETRGGRGPRQREKKILIFTNTVDLCCAVNAWLGVHHATAPPLTLPSGEPQESDSNGEDAGSGVGSMETRSPALRGVSDSKVDELLTSVGDALGSRLGAPHLAEKGAAGEGEASSAAGVCLSVGMYHKKMSTAGRAEALSTFQAGSSRSSKLSQASSTHASVLVCTDAASRGLDFTDVTHVIQADMAQNVVDHLHRLGRMARTGGSVQIGCGISLVTDNDSLLVDAIERAAQHSDDKDALGREAFSRRRGLRKRERKKVKDNRKE